VPEPDLTVLDRPELQRYEAFLEEQLVGFMEYRKAGPRRILLHTEVDPAFGGRGIGGAFARQVLDGARAAGERITVKCPFLLSFIARHPEYADLATPRRRPARGT
jgi:predicted GNAT family acetyltransferase